MKMIMEMTDVPVAYILQENEKELKIVGRNGVTLIVKSESELNFKIIDAFEMEDNKRILYESHEDFV